MTDIARSQKKRKSGFFLEPAGLFLIGILSQILLYLLPSFGENSVIIFFKVVGTWILLLLYPGYFLVPYLFTTRNLLGRLSRAIVTSIVFLLILTIIFYFTTIPICFVSLLVAIYAVTGMAAFHLQLRNPAEKNYLKGILNSITRDVKLSLQKYQNFLLFFGFLLIWSLFNLLRYELIFGIDPWEHLRVTANIARTGTIDFSEYEGYLGLHAVGAVAVLLSGANPFFIVYYYPLILIVVSGLVAYELANKFFQNVEFSALAVLLMFVIPYGFFSGQSQYWPTGLVVLLALSALSQLIDYYEAPARTSSRSLTILGAELVVLSLIHEVVSLFYLSLFGIVWFFFILMKNRDWRIHITILGGVIFHFVYSAVFPSALSWKIFSVFLAFPWYFIAVGGIGAIFISYMLFKVIWKRINYKGRPFYEVFKFEIGEGSYHREKTRNEKLVPFVLLIPVLVTPLVIIFAIPYMSSWLFHTSFNVILPAVYMLEGILLCAIGVEKLYKVGPRGKILFLWAILFGLVFLTFLILDAIFKRFPWWPRAMMICGPMVAIGTIGYLYRHALLGTYRSRKRAKILFLSFFLLAIVGGMQYEANIQISMTREEDHALQWIAGHVPSNVTLVGGVRIRYILDYYSGKSFDVGQYRFSYYLFPDRQWLDNGTYGPAHLMRTNKTQGLYLFISETHLTHGIFSIDGNTLGKLTEADVEAYSHIRELNRVFAGPRGIQVYQYNGH